MSQRQGSHAKRSTPFDQYIGERVRLARQSRGLSQDALGRHVGLTFQQVQKYERGYNRISAGRLYQMSVVLSLDVTFFFDGLERPDAIAIKPQKDEAASLFAAVSSIKDSRVRKQLMALITALAADDIPRSEATLNRKRPRKAR